MMPPPFVAQRGAADVFKTRYDIVHQEPLRANANQLLFFFPPIQHFDTNRSARTMETRQIFVFNF
jgi:hypothetical protein